MRWLAVLMLLLAGISGARAESTLRVIMQGEPDSLDPYASTTAYGSWIDNQLFTSLTEYRPDGTLGPGAATSWTTSADGLTYRFKLRPDMTWSDGKPMTAADWVYSLQRQVDPKTMSQGASQFYSIAGAEQVNLGKAPLSTLGVAAVDPYTLEIRLNTPSPYLASLLSSFQPVPKQAIEAYGSNWVQPNHFVGNGAYVLTENVPHTRISLARNPHILADFAPHFDKVSILLISDQQAALTRYLAGEADLVYAVEASQFKQIPPDRVSERHLFPASSSSMLTLNTKRAPLDDIRVREALSLAIDRDVIANKVIGAGAAPSTTIVPGDWAGLKQQHAPAALAQPLDQRRALAKSLLAQAGYSAAKQPSVEILYSGERAQHVAVVLQAMWRGIGVNAKIRSSEVSALFNSYHSGDYQVGVLTWDMGTLHDPDVLLSAFLPGGYGDFNRTRLPAYESVHSRALAEPDLAKRSALMADTEGALLANWDLVPLYVTPMRYLIAPGIGGWQPNSQPLIWHYLTPKAATATAN